MRDVTAVNVAADEGSVIKSRNFFWSMKEEEEDKEKRCGLWKAIKVGNMETLWLATRFPSNLSLYL